MVLRSWLLFWFAGFALSCASNRDDPHLVIDHESSGRRVEAALALREQPGPRAILALRRHLDDPESRVRIAVIISIGHIGGENVVSDLTPALEDESLEVRRAAIEALGEISGDSVIEPLLTALADREAEIRMLARRTLIEIGLNGREQVERGVELRRKAVLEQVASSSWSIRLSAARELALCGDDQSLRALAQLTEDREMQIATEAARGIGRAGGGSDGSVLEGLLQNEHLPLRRAVLDGLARSPGSLTDEVSETVCRLVLDGDSSIHAAKVASSHHLACPISELESSYEAAQRDLRIHAAQTLVILGELVPRSTRLTAAEILWREGTSDQLMGVAALDQQPVGAATARVVTEIERYLDGSERWIQPPVSESEARDGQPPDGGLPVIRDEGTLVEHLINHPPRVRGWVEMFPATTDPETCAALLLLSAEVGVLADRETLERLARRAPHPQVRAAAVWALGGGEPNLEDPVPIVRAAAAEALQGRAHDLSGSTKARLALMLTDDAPGVRAAAAKTLAASDDPHALRPLLAAFERWREPALVRALARIGGPEATTALITFIGSRGPSVESELLVIALDALSQLGDRALASEVLPFIGHPDPRVRLAAVRAAGSIGGDERLLELVEERRFDYALEVREASNRALAELDGAPDS